MAGNYGLEACWNTFGSCSKLFGVSGESWPGQGLGFTCLFSVCLYILIDVEGFLVLLFKFFVRVL